MDAAERTFRQRIAAADATTTRLRRALEAGWDPEALTNQYNAAVAEKKAALAALEALEPAERLSSADIRAMVKELGAMNSKPGEQPTRTRTQLEVSPDEVDIACRW